MKKEEVRNKFPECCAVADVFRKVFGKEVRLTYAAENNHEAGKRSQPGVKINVIHGDEFSKMRKVSGNE